MGMVPALVMTETRMARAMANATMIATLAAAMEMATAASVIVAMMIAMMVAAVAVCEGSNTLICYDCSFSKRLLP